MEDGVTCTDIDECDSRSPAVCSQLCINTPGSYQCDCYPGYIMEAGGRNCKITGTALSGLHSWLEAGVFSIAVIVLYVPATVF